ncbi:MAG: signal recognition particle protein Srp19 [Euryarchaeota archaeon]|nr:signal recognition particle protein Srp19 [Euryarchaeota archaeon]
MRDKLIVWTNYIDAQKSKKEGRRISKSDAVASPTLGEIQSAAEKLGLRPVIEKEKAYPKEWWGSKGRILIEKSRQKNKALKEIAMEIRRMRK